MKNNKNTVNYKGKGIKTVHPQSLLPKGATCGDIEYLNLSHNLLTNLKGLEGFPNLLSADISHNQLCASLGFLTNSITDLDISHNDLSSLVGIDAISSLKYLDCSHNEITSLERLGKNTRVIAVNASFNKIKTVKGLHSLKALKQLNVAHNEVFVLEGLEDLGNNRNLVELDVGHNPVSKDTDFPVLCQRMLPRITKLIADPKQKQLNVEATANETDELDPRPSPNRSLLLKSWKPSSKQSPFKVRRSPEATVQMAALKSTKFSLARKIANLESSLSKTMKKHNEISGHIDDMKSAGIAEGNLKMSKARVNSTMTEEQLEGILRKTADICREVVSLKSSIQEILPELKGNMHAQCEALLEGVEALGRRLTVMEGSCRSALSDTANSNKENQLPSSLKQSTPKLLGSSKREPPLTERVKSPLRPKSTLYGSSKVSFASPRPVQISKLQLSPSRPILSISQLSSGDERTDDETDTVTRPSLVQETEKRVQELEYQYSVIKSEREDAMKELKYVRFEGEVTENSVESMHSHILALERREVELKEKLREMQAVTAREQHKTKLAEARAKSQYQDALNQMSKLADKEKVLKREAATAREREESTKIEKEHLAEKMRMQEVKHNTAVQEKDYQLATMHRKLKDVQEGHRKELKARGKTATSTGLVVLERIVTSLYNATKVGLFMKWRKMCMDEAVQKQKAEMAKEMEQLKRERRKEALRSRLRIADQSIKEYWKIGFTRAYEHWRTSVRCCRWEELWLKEAEIHRQNLERVNDNWMKKILKGKVRSLHRLLNQHILSRGLWTYSRGIDNMGWEKIADEQAEAEQALQGTIDDQKEEIQRQFGDLESAKASLERKSEVVVSFQARLLTKTKELRNLRRLYSPFSALQRHTHSEKVESQKEKFQKELEQRRVELVTRTTKLAASSVGLIERHRGARWILSAWQQWRGNVFTAREEMQVYDRALQMRYYARKMAKIVAVDSFLTKWRTRNEARVLGEWKRFSEGEKFSEALQKERDTSQDRKLLCLRIFDLHTTEKTSIRRKEAVKEWSRWSSCSQYEENVKCLEGQRDDAEGRYEGVRKKMVMSVIVNRISEIVRFRCVTYLFKWHAWMIDCQSTEHGLECERRHQEEQAEYRRRRDVSIAWAMASSKMLIERSSVCKAIAKWSQFTSRSALEQHRQESEAVIEKVNQTQTLKLREISAGRLRDVEQDFRNKQMSSTLLSWDRYCKKQKEDEDEERQRKINQDRQNVSLKATMVATGAMVKRLETTQLLKALEAWKCFSHFEYASEGHRAQMDVLKIVVEDIQEKYRTSQECWGKQTQRLTSHNEHLGIRSFASIIKALGVSHLRRSFYVYRMSALTISIRRERSTEFHKARYRGAACLLEACERRAQAVIASRALHHLWSAAVSRPIETYEGMVDPKFNPGFESPICKEKAMRSSLNNMSESIGYLQQKNATVLRQLEEEQTARDALDRDHSALRHDYARLEEQLSLLTEEHQTAAAIAKESGWYHTIQQRQLDESTASQHEQERVAEIVRKLISKISLVTQQATAEEEMRVKAEEQAEASIAKAVEMEQRLRDAEANAELNHAKLVEVCGQLLPRPRVQDSATSPLVNKDTTALSGSQLDSYYISPDSRPDAGHFSQSALTEEESQMLTHDITRLQVLVEEIQVKETEIHEREQELERKVTVVEEHERQLVQRAEQLDNREQDFTILGVELDHREAELVSLSKQLSQLQEEVAEREKRLADSEENRRVLQEQVDTLRDEQGAKQLESAPRCQLTQTDTTAEDLSNSLDKAARFQEVSSSLEKVQKERDEVQDLLAEKTAELQETKTSLEVLNQDLSNELAVAQSLVSEGKEQIAEYQRQLSELNARKKDEIDALERMFAEEKQRFEDEKSKAEDDRALLCSERDDLHRKVVAATEKEESLSTQITELQSQVDEAISRNCNLSTKLGVEIDENERLERSLHSLELSLDSFRREDESSILQEERSLMRSKERFSHETDPATLLGELEVLGEKIEKGKYARLQGKKALERVGGELAKRVEEVKLLKDRVEELERDNCNLERERDMATKRDEETTIYLKKAEEELRLAMREKELAVSDRDMSRTKISRLQSELVSCQASLKVSEENNEQKLQQLQHMRNSTDRGVSEREHLLTSQKRHISDLEEQLEGARRELAETQRQLQSKEIQVEEMKRDNQILHGKVHNLKIENDRLLEKNTDLILSNKHSRGLTSQQERLPQPSSKMDPRASQEIPQHSATKPLDQDLLELTEVLREGQAKLEEAQSVETVLRVQLENQQLELQKVKLDRDFLLGVVSDLETKISLGHGQPAQGRALSQLTSRQTMTAAAPVVAREPQDMWNKVFTQTSSQRHTMQGVLTNLGQAAGRSSSSAAYGLVKHNQKQRP